MTKAKVVNLNKDRLKRRGLMLLLFAIFVAANFEDPMGVVNHGLYRPLSFFGLDVAMTPITADMMFMVDRQSQKPLYLRQPQLQVQWQDIEQQDLSLRQLDFYLFRLPLLLMMESVSYGYSPPESIQRICRALHYEFHQDPRQWRLQLHPREASDSPFNFERWFRCPPTKEFL